MSQRNAPAGSRCNARGITFVSLVAKSLQSRRLGVGVGMLRLDVVETPPTCPKTLIERLGLGA